MHNILEFLKNIFIFFRYKRYESFLVRRNIKDFELQKYEEFLNKIPKHILNTFLEQGSVIYISKNFFLEMGEFKGRYFPHEGKPKTKIILIHKEYKTLLHEFGHFWDCSNGLFSLSSRPEFIEIFHTERDIAWKKLNYKDYYTGRSSEYFAETFAQILLNENAVKEALPLTYAYMMNCLEEKAKTT